MSFSNQFEIQQSHILFIEYLWQLIFLTIYWPPNVKNLHMKKNHEKGTGRIVSKNIRNILDTMVAINKDWFQIIKILSQKVLTNLTIKESYTGD